MIIDIRFTTARAPIQLQRVMRTTIRQNAPGDSEIIVIFAHGINNESHSRFALNEIESFSVYND